MTNSWKNGTDSVVKTHIFIMVTLLQSLKITKCNFERQKDFYNSKKSILDILTCTAEHFLLLQTISECLRQMVHKKWMFPWWHHRLLEIFSCYQLDLCSQNYQTYCRGWTQASNYQYMRYACPLGGSPVTLSSSCHHERKRHAGTRKQSVNISF